jgi:hypothetical protein
MSGDRESALWGWLSKAEKALRHELHLIRVENSTERGTPDVEGCLNGNTFWLELKSAIRPANPKTPLDFPTRKEQIDWGKRRRDAGGRSGYLLRVVSANGRNRRVYLLNAAYGRRLHDKKFTEADLQRLDLLRPNTNATPAMVVQIASKFL